MELGEDEDDEEIDKEKWWAVHNKIFMIDIYNQNRSGDTDEFFDEILLKRKTNAEIDSLKEELKSLFEMPLDARAGEQYNFIVSVS